MGKMLLVLLILILCAAIEAWAESPILLKVSPQVLLNRSDVRIEVRVRRDQRNRLLIVSWDSESGSGGATRRQLDGEDAAVLYEIIARDLVPANYEIRATTYDEYGKQVATALGRIVSPEEK
jgi:hypothetical protein